MNKKTTFVKEDKKSVSLSDGAKRRLRYRISFYTTIAITVAAVILLNVLVGAIADKHPINIDLSAKKTYTLSAQSITIAKQVKSPIELIIFEDRSIFENPSTGVDELDTTLREFTNALKQYNSHSGGKITYTFIDPNQEPAKFAAYAKYEVEKGDMLFLCGERYKVRTIYDGQYANDLYTLDTSMYAYDGTYTFESNTEKLLASNIYALSSGEEHIVQVLTGHEEDQYTIDGLKNLYELNGYTFEDVSIVGSVEFNKDADIMLIAAPEKDYSTEEIKRVREWVYNGGNYGRQLMVYVSPTADCPNLYEFLKVEYKITVTDELILETDYNRLQNFNQFYPMTDIPDTTYTANAVGEAVVFTPYARRITTSLPSELTEGTGEYAIPLTSYPTSAQLIKLETLEDADAGEDAIYAAGDDAYPLTGMIVYAFDGYFNSDADKPVEGRVMVSGCSSIAYTNYVQTSTLKNEELLLDTLNTMTGIENAITISGKTVETDRVTFTPATQLIVGLGIFTIGLPLITLIVCLVIFIRRKHL